MPGKALRGICPVCGREMALMRGYGRLAEGKEVMRVHGRRTPYNDSSCPGSGEPPARRVTGHDG